MRALLNSSGVKHSGLLHRIHYPEGVLISPLIEGVVSDL